MANTPISQLVTLTNPATGDLLAIVDISDTSQSINGTTKNITLATLGLGNQVFGEVPSGSGTTFTLANIPAGGNIRLYRGGARQQVGLGNDYTLSGATITLAYGLSSGEVLLCDYSY